MLLAPGLPQLCDRCFCPSGKTVFSGLSTCSCSCIPVNCHCSCIGFSVHCWFSSHFLIWMWYLDVPHSLQFLIIYWLTLFEQLSSKVGCLLRGKTQFFLVTPSRQLLMENSLIIAWRVLMLVNQPSYWTYLYFYWFLFLCPFAMCYIFILYIKGKDMHSPWEFYRMSVGHFAHYVSKEMKCRSWRL